MRMKRREFLAGSIAAGVVLFGRPYARVLGANEDIRVAVVGFNSRGKAHISAFAGMKGVRVTALCDCDRKVLDGEVAKLDAKGIKVAAYQDVRRVFDDKNVDCVATATPNHWHSLIVVWGCQAGKDVYVEKPISHDIWVGHQAVEAARKYNRIVQCGSQHRSDAGLGEAFEWIRAGNLGKMVCLRGFCYKPRGNIGKATGPTPIPPEVDYDLWCGPAPKKPLMRKKLHYDWHWFWDTGNGDIGNQGIHEMDFCRWAGGYTAPAARAMSIGGRFVHDDDAETPNTQIAFIDYKPVPIIFEVRGLPRKTGDSAMDNYRGTRIGVVVDCEGGYYVGGAGGGWMYDKNGEKVKQFPGREGRDAHQSNFIKAVRSRKKEDLNADILEGHLSATAFHLANVSYLLGQERPAGEIAERTKGNSTHAECFERFKAHLEANGVDLAKSQIVLGPWVDFDPAKEVVTGDLAAEASKYVRRAQRAPFVIPDQV